jgi:hypothetical protein
MRWFITILCALAISISSFAQKIQLIDASEEITATSGSKVYNKLKIKNTSGELMRLAVSIADSELAASQDVSLCYNGNCLDASGNNLDIITLLPGTTTNDLELRFTAGLDESESSIKYLFVDIDHPKEAITHTFNYKVRTAAPNGIMYTGKGISVSNAYPNPVTDLATIDFSMESAFKDAKIIFYNVLGDKVLDVPLNQFDSNIKIPTDNLKVGVYFYTLYLENKGMVTKKLIVRK